MWAFPSESWDRALWVLVKCAWKAWRARLQVKYVVELARALAQHPAVYRVELMTRLIQDPAVDDSYGQPSEVLWRPPGEHDKGLGGAHLIRLPCGPSDTYLRCAIPACACRGPVKCS